MKAEVFHLTHGEALLNAPGDRAAVAAVAAPVIVQAEPEDLANDAPYSVSENDSPFFGGEVPEGY